MFFTYGGNTEQLANYIAQKTEGKLVEIVAEVPYTAVVTNYSSDNTRCETEMQNNARPAISNETFNNINIDDYDTVMIGYPIWWWTAPMIIGTFLKHYDFSGHDIYPFSQS